MTSPTQDNFCIGNGSCFRFCGRQTDLQKLELAWKSHKIFGIYGIRSVGKSRLAQEFIKNVTQNLKPLTYIYLNAKGLCNTSAIYTELCIKLDLEQNGNACDTDNWITDIANAIRFQKNGNFVMLFDNTEDFQEGDLRDPFLQLCATLAKQCDRIKIVITSTTKAQFSQLRLVYFSHELLPLLPSETLELLKLSAPDVNFGKYSDAIVSLSEGLPLLIIMIGSELMEDWKLIPPEEMVQLLLSYRLKVLSREFYPKEDRVADVYTDCIRRLDEVNRHRLAMLQYIPGSFNATEAKQILDYPSLASVKDQVLIPIRRRNMLQYDSSTGRFRIQGILRECIQSFFAIKNIPEIRARYCQTFTSVMMTLSKQLDTVEYTKALSMFVQEQPNLQKLLTEVKYADRQCYGFFIEMATSCTGLIERYLTGDSEEFYHGCLKMAAIYGKDVDKAVVHIAVGSLYTNTKCNFHKGSTNYEAALEILSNKGNSLHLATAYQRMGWNMLQQGQHNQAIGYFRKSLSISMTSGKDYEVIAAQSLTSMGVILTLLGQFEDAEKYHFIAQEQLKKVHGPDHPSIGANLNNIGLMYDQKGDSKNAMKYFIEGLELKKKANAPPLSIMLSLSNVANVYTSLKQFEKAHELMCEAEKLLNEQNVKQCNVLSLLCDTKGKIYMAEGQLDNALEMFEKSEKLREELMPGSIVYMETLIHKAGINKLQKKYNNSLKVANKALTLKDKVIKEMPQTSLIAECLECVADVYDSVGDIKNYRETLEKLESELLRLEQVHICHCNDFKIESIRKQLLQVRSKLT